MDENLGEQIRRLRETRRWTQGQLASLLGVSTKTVSNWETGRNDPRSSLGALQELFGRQLRADAEPTDVVTEVDDVERAIRASGLHKWRQNAVLSTYELHLQQQRAEGTG